jgi:hypothetical protein
MEPLLILYSKPDCPLCDAAEVALREVSRRLPVRWQKVDISTDPGLMERWGWRIPVVCAGEMVLDEGRVSAGRLLRALEHGAAGAARAD